MAREATLSVSLTNQLKSYVRGKVDSGQYESASEVIRQGLRTLQEQEERERLYWSDLRKKVKEARTAIADGDVVDGPAFMRSKIAAIKSRGRAKTPVAKRNKQI
jgi:antitoxin ParD1/3/4